MYTFFALFRIFCYGVFLVALFRLQFHQNQPLPNPIHIQNSSSSALVGTRFHFPLNETINSSYIGNNAFYGFLPGSGNPSILQSPGPTVCNAFNHTSVHPLYHNNKYLLAPQPSSTISASTVPQPSYLPSNLPIHVQPSMVTLNPIIESTDNLNRIISNSFSIENRTHENNNNTVSQSVIHPNFGISCTNHLSNKNYIPRELTYPSFGSHQNFLNQSTIRKSSSMEPVNNTNQIQSTTSGVVATTVQTVSTTTSVPVLDKQIPVTVCSTSATTITTTTTATASIPISSIIDNNFDSMFESSFDGVLWGRICRRADGDLMLPGLGRLCTFKSPNSVLRQICQMTKAEDSLALQLSPSRFQSEIEQNCLSTSSLNPSSKNDFHICPCCRLTFTSNSVYECHMNRSIAHMYYRCHLCIELNDNNNMSVTNSQIPVNTTNATSVNSMLIPNEIIGTDSINRRNISSVATTTTTTTATTTTTSTTINNNNQKIVNHKNVADFQFYSILPGNIIKATNHCAIFCHFISAHPNQMDLWTLKSSLLTIYSLKGSITCADLRKSSLSDLLSNAQKEKTSSNQVPNQSDKIPSDPFSNLKCLSGILSDLHQSLNNISGLENYDILHPSSSTSVNINNKNGYDYNVLLNSPIISASDYDDNIIIEKFCSLQRIYTPIVIHCQKQITNGNTTDNSIHHRQSHFDLHLPKLPSSDSLLFRIILSLANSDIWHTHLFLSNWCDNNSNNANKSLSNENGIVDKWSTFMCCYAANNNENNSSDILFSIDDDDDNDDDYGDDDDDGDDEDRCRDNGHDFHSNNNCNSNEKSVVDRNFQSKLSTKRLSLAKLCDICLPPSAPSNTYLNQALGSLIFSSHDDHHASTCFTNATINRTSDDIYKPKSIMKSNVDQQFGILRCLICQFRTNNHKLLIEHLIGNPPFNHTKCGLCGQLLFANQPSLCSVKAHLLLHLGCYLMCPQCGFTPPLHLPPDCAELCLRVHLRFVCYHFNLKEIFRCNYCDGDGKAYPTYDNLCHHHLRHHVKRIYSCLWCARQLRSNNYESNNNNTNYTSSKAFQISETTGDNASIPVHDVSKRKITSTAHMASIHMNKENIKLPCSTTTSHKNARPNSNKSNSSHGSVNSSIPNKTPNIFRSNSIQELLYHLRNVHRSSVIPSAIERTNKCVAVHHEVELSDNVLTIDVPESPPPHSLHPSVVVVGHNQTSSVNNDVRKVGYDGVTSSDPQKSSKNSDVLQMIDELQKNITNNNDNNVKNKLSIHLAPKVDYSVGLQCIECSKELSTKEHYMEHFQKEHGSKCNRESFYRCFGACKRLLPNIDDFREHLTECLHAQSIYYSTFGHLYNKDKAFDLFNVDLSPINIENNNNNKHTNNELQEQLSVNNTDRIYSKNVYKINNHSIGDNSNTILGCKLCFCAYCGIGSQKKSMMNSSSINLLDPVLPSFKSCTSDDGNSIPNINNNNNDDDNNNSQLNNNVNVVLQSQFSVDSVSTDYLSEDDHTGFDTTKQSIQNNTIKQHNTNIQRHSLYTPQYFSNLINLRIHENNCHYSKRNKLIACPWCHVRMTCTKKDKSRTTHMHLLSHLHKHCMATWCLERMRKWNENAKVLPNCVCGLALLDSPQAILSHAGVHLLYTNKYKSSNNIPDSLHHRSYKRSLSSSSSSSASLKSQLNSSEEFLFPKPSDHIPCPIKIYRHLRFGVSAKFDAHLSEFTHRSSYFTCPVCMTKLSTRWALTQHAFSEHWGTLCYICCVYIFKPTEGNSSVESNNHNINTTNICTISSSSSCPSSSSSSTARSVATFDKRNHNDKSKSDLSTTTLWDHIFVCMNERLELLTTRHHNTSTSSSLIRTSNDQNNADCSLAEVQSNFEKENNDLSILHNVSNTPIIIDSSPENYDHGKLVCSQQTNCNSYYEIVNTSLSTINPNIITTSTIMFNNPSIDNYVNSINSSITTAISSFIPSTNNLDKYVHKIFNNKLLKTKNTNRKHSLQLNNNNYDYISDDDDNRNDDRNYVGKENGFNDYIINNYNDKIIESKSSELNTLSQFIPNISKKRRRISNNLNNHTRNNDVWHNEIVKNNLITCTDSSVPTTNHNIITSSSSSSMNRSTISGNYLQNSDLDEQECSTICLVEDVNTEKICVICGKKQTADTWEEHCLSHRNPKMAWDGVRISQPNRPAFCESKSTKVYRCYICYRRFTIRFSCFRHMITVHRLKKSQLDTNLLTELFSPNSTQKSFPELNKLSSELGNCSLNLSANIDDIKNHISLKKTANITGSTSNSSSSSTTTTTTSTLRDHSIHNNNHNNKATTCNNRTNQNKSVISSISKSKFYCSICHISFISNESLSRHCISAHGKQQHQQKV
ncbi:unnamed protein product [Schistosoma rodhaini]|uniref:C2H2-type domain-containing protein n=1 Tax=Schistosoma rodhaini TaxID=6188 RepID=A0AA85GI98_9TREM|nr:unnamed protein product [Schistosoma rodhaini]